MLALSDWIALMGARARLLPRPLVVERLRILSGETEAAVETALQAAGINP